MNKPRIVRVGIVGGGLAALMAYTVLRFRGLKRSEIAVFAPETSPEQSWEKFARSINMFCLRSESTGHFYPTDSPGLATIEAIKRKSLRPIIQAWFDRFHPSLDAFLEHTKHIARQTGFTSSLLPATIGQIDRVNDNWLGIYNTNQQLIAYAQHVILAIGHGAQRVPKAVAKFRTGHPSDSRVTLSYQEKKYQPKTVLVLGDGITAATEWANVLQAGGVAVVVSSNGFAFGQPLQVPRKYFSKRGLAPYGSQNREERTQELKQATRGTVPGYGRWLKMFARAQDSGRLGFSKGRVMTIHPLADGRLACEVDLVGQSRHTIIVDQVISATGFAPAATHPLLKNIIEKYRLKTSQETLEIDNNGCIQELSTLTSILAVIGPAAAWAVPCADSLGGMKITARRLANIIIGKESLSPVQLVRQTKQWLRIVTGKKLA